jgi:hypothetical protein
MKRQLVLSVVFLFVIGASELIGAQEEAGTSSAQVRIRSVRAIPQVYVALQLSASDQQLFVPYCGESEGTKFLCTVAAHLEIASQHGWRAAKHNTESGVLGGVSLENAVGITFERGKEGVFTFQFSPSFFEVRSGQRLRIIIDAWPDEQSMKRDHAVLHLVSPPFVCP